MCHVFYGLVFGNRLHKNFKRFQNPMNQQNHQEYRQSGPLCTPQKKNIYNQKPQTNSIYHYNWFAKGGGGGLSVFSCYSSFFAGKEQRH